MLDGSQATVCNYLFTAAAEKGQREGESRGIQEGVHRLKRKAECKDDVSAYSSAVEEKLKEADLSDDTNLDVEKLWGVIRDAMTTAAEETLGRTSRRQPDWFRDSESIIRPLIEARNCAFTKWLKSKDERDRKAFVRCRRKIVKVVREVKNKWFTDQAEKIEKAKDDKWKLIKQLKFARAGLMSSRAKALNKLNGEKCKGPAEILTRWQEHFDGVLNVASTFDGAVLDRVDQLPLREDLDVAPTEEEILAAVGKLKREKAGGGSEILPEMLMFGPQLLIDHLVRLCGVIWKNRKAPEEWRDAFVVPVPKKGDLRDCNNSRGISLLDVVGKVFARVMMSRLQVVGEDSVFEDSQAGFRALRQCMDMIFSCRQLVEKVLEQNDKVFLLFIDLTKAYDSVPRELLWKLLAKYGFPESMIEVIKSMHNGMEARVKVDGKLSDKFIVNNGLRQGCTMATALFNLFFTAVIKEWRVECGDRIGIDVHYVKDGGKLTGIRKQKKRSVRRVTEMQFADDAAAVFTSWDRMSEAAHLLMAVTRRWGLTVSIKKTEFMRVGKEEEGDTASLVVGDRGEEMKWTQNFKYLGSLVEGEGGVEKDVMRRIGIASSVFGGMRRSVWNDGDLTRRTKRMVYNSAVMGTLSYGMAAWAIPQKLVSKLEGFHRRCVRGVAGVTRKRQRDERITTEQVQKMVGIERTFAEMMRKQRLRWLGHVGRMSEERLPFCMMYGKLAGDLPRGGRKKRWKDRVNQDLAEVGVGQNEWFELAQDRVAWDAICRMKGSVVAETTEIVKCGTCGKDGIKGARGMAAHKRYCGRGTSAARHMVPESVVEVEREAGTKPTYKCSTCEMSIKTLAGVRRHVEANCGKNRAANRGLSAKEREELSADHQCMGCNKKFSSKRNLVQHRNKTNIPGCKLPLT